MAKKEEFAKNKKNLPYAVLRKGAVCALVGASALAGGLLVGCDEGSVQGPAGVNFYYGVEAPNEINKEGKVGDFYIETDDGNVWQLTAEGWVEISNIKGPQGDPGETPTISISQDGYWVINGIKSNIKAEGQDAEAPTIEINQDGYWVINGQPTNKKASGEDAEAPEITIGQNGNWEIDGQDTGVKAQGEKGDPGEQGVSVVNVTLQPYADRDGNTYMDYTFHYSNDTTTTERVYTGSTIYVGEEMTLEKALEVVAIGGTVELKTDIELEKVLVVNKKATIDLAGHYIYNEKTPLWNDTAELNDWSLISVREGGDLTIEDSGVLVEDQGEYGTETYTEYGGLVAMENDCYAIDIQEGAKCTINGSGDSFDTMSTVFAGNISAVYVHTGELVVNSGMFLVQQLDQNTGDERFTLNCYNENYKNGTAKITVNGGMFLNCDPAKAGDDGNYVSSTNMVVGIPTEMEEPGQFATIYMVVPSEFAMQMLQTIPAGMPVSATLGGDMVLPAQGIVISDGVDLTIDLNGYTISAPNDESGDGVFHVLAGGKLTINDSTGAGRIDAECKSVYKMAVWADGGEVIINGGTFTNATTDGTETQYDMMYVKNGGIITINGGIFDCKTPKWTLNSHNTYTGTFVVNGGTFKNYNPSASMTDENDGNVPPTNFVAEGYVVVEETVGQDVWYTVVEDAE